jgi:arylsulfatase A-like enzyme
MSPVFGLDAGFEEYSSEREWGSLQHTVPPALAWLEQSKEAPFLLFVHGYDAHHRYLKPSPWGYLFSDVDHPGGVAEATRRPSGTTRLVDGYYFEDLNFDQIFYWRDIRMRSDASMAAIRRQAEGLDLQPLDEADLEHIRGLYAGATTYADAWFGELMAGLEAQDLLDKVVIVVFSDHGEELGEEGLFNHRLSLDERLLHVPLMIRLPEARQAGTRVSEQVALLDVMPTLLEAAGASALADARGKSLWALAEGGSVEGHPYIFAESPARAVATRGPDGLVEFTGLAAHSPFLTMIMDTASLTGPAFESELTGAPLENARQAMVGWRQSLPPSPGNEAIVDAERIKVLQESGYWGSAP